MVQVSEDIAINVHGDTKSVAVNGEGHFLDKDFPPLPDGVRAMEWSPAREGRCKGYIWKKGGGNGHNDFSAFVPYQQAWAKAKAASDLAASIERAQWLAEDDNMAFNAAKAVAQGATATLQAATAQLQAIQPQRGAESVPVVATEGTAGAGPAVVAPPEPTFTVTDPGHTMQGSNEQSTIFGDGPADPPDPPLPRGIMPDNGWVKQLTGNIDAEEPEAAEQPDDGEAANLAAPVGNEPQGEQPQAAVPEPSPLKASDFFSQLPPINEPGTSPDEMVTETTVTTTRTGRAPAQPQGTQFVMPVPAKSVVVDDEWAKSEIRYQVAVRAYNGETEASMMLKPAADRRGVSVKDLAIKIMQDRAATEQKVLSEF